MARKDRACVHSLNSVDLPAQPWALFRFMSFPGESPEARFVEDFMKSRLRRMETVLSERQYLVGGQFSVADLLMADVLQQLDKFDGLAEFPACHAYVARATVRPAFVKAHGNQLAHFAAADPAQ
jgi:glutathione S-transferase